MLQNSNSLVLCKVSKGVLRGLSGGFFDALSVVRTVSAVCRKHVVYEHSAQWGRWRLLWAGQGLARRYLQVSDG